MPQLSQPITYRTLLAFAVPMIVSQLFMNVNFIVDGFFVAHAVGTDGLSAINIVMPFIPLTIVLATMLGTGGSALVAAQLGAGENRHSRENFSLLVNSLVILFQLVELPACGLALLLCRLELVLLGGVTALFDVVLFVVLRDLRRLFIGESESLEFVFCHRFLHSARLLYRHNSVRHGTTSLK